MEKVEKKLREEAKKLLAEKKVDVVVGYEAGTLPLTATPVFITTPEETDKLVWNSFCQHNLAKIVHDLIIANRDSQKRLKPEDRKRKVVGVVTKGCTSRSLVIHLQERQYERLDTVILGVPCTGYMDRKKLAAKLGGEDILEGSLDGADLKIKTASGEKTIALKEVLAENCLTCRINNPVISDAMMGEPAPAMDTAAEYAGVDEFEKLSPRSAGPTSKRRWPSASAAPPAGRPARPATARSVSPSRACPSGWGSARTPRTRRSSSSCGCSTWWAAASTAAPASACAPWAWT